MIDVSFAACDRLIETASNHFAHIGNLADFAALESLPKRFPSVFVLPLTESSAGNEAIGSSVQMHVAGFAVVYLLRYAGDATGARAVAALADLREVVQSTLVGWTPAKCHAPVAFENGVLTDFEAGGVVSWRDDFSVSRQYVRPLSNL